jgi:outer membrane protein assembly factor BamB
MKTLICLILVLTCSSICNAQIQSEQWPQFRGVNGSGMAAETAMPPITFDNSTLSWRIELPQGISSPVIWKDKLFLTGFDEAKKELQVICINRKNGKILWNNQIKPDTLEKAHQIGSPAQSTVVTDGERLVAYFGSCGLFCYDLQGKLLWKYPIACNSNVYGSAASPVISGDRLILLRDVSNPFLLSIYLKNGIVAWKTSLKSNPASNEGGQSVPCIYKDMIYVHRNGEIVCFSLIDGSQKWSYKLITKGISSPIIAGNIILTACWSNLIEEDQRVYLPVFDDLSKNYDKNHNGTISKNEFPEDLFLYRRPETSDLENTSGTVKRLINFFDTNKDGEITRPEWEALLDLFKKTYYKPSGLLAFNPQNSGNLSEDNVLWRVIENIPEVPTPIFYKGKVYMIKDGGIISCVDPESGHVFYTTRIGNTGSYISSPVAANGFIYIIGFNGKMKILKAGDKFEIAGEYDFKDKVEATPAIIGNTIYIRTGTALTAYTKK